MEKMKQYNKYNNLSGHLFEMLPLQMLKSYLLELAIHYNVMHLHTNLKFQFTMSDRQTL